MLHTEEERTALEAKYHPVAEAGDAEAQFQLGMLYNGYAPETDRKVRKTEALRWFRKAAEQGHIEALYWTGLYYRFGLEVVAMDQAEANAWFLKAAEKGHTGAMMKLGRFREAADLGDPRAQYHLGTQYEEEDPAAAMSWYLKALNNAAAGDGRGSTAGEAAYAIAKMYEKDRGVPKNDETAVAWLFKAAERGNPEAPWDIADRYAKGIGIIKDTAVAAEWYVEAESRDADLEPVGRDIKNICKARGVPLEEMLAAYRKAAETCVVWADYLGDLYEYGYGVVAPDEAESQKWRRKAALGFSGFLADVETEGGTH